MRAKELVKQINKAIKKCGRDLRIDVSIGKSSNGTIFCTPIDDIFVEISKEKIIISKI